MGREESCPGPGGLAAVAVAAAVEFAVGVVGDDVVVAAEGSTLRAAGSAVAGRVAAAEEWVAPAVVVVLVVVVAVAEAAAGPELEIALAVAGSGCWPSSE